MSTVPRIDQKLLVVLLEKGEVMGQYFELIVDQRRPNVITHRFGEPKNCCK